MSQPLLHFVYALVDPRTNDVGYVGRTSNPNERFQQHLQNIGGVNSKQKHAWIQQLLAEHVEPRFEILETVRGGLKQARLQEKIWIRHYAAMEKAPLVNVHHRRVLDTDIHYSIQPMDMYMKGAVIYCLELEMYGFPEIEVAADSWLTDFPRRTASWFNKNRDVYWFAGWCHDPLRAGDAWASLGILPLKEDVILRLLRGEIVRHDIQAEDVLPYEVGHSYTCYISSAAYRVGKQVYLAQAFQHVLVYLCSQGIWINKLYASAPYDTNETPMQYLVREHFFKSVPILGQNAWVLSLQDLNPSPAIQAYQKERERVLSREK
jgi:hypothetical protein